MCTSGIPAIPPALLGIGAEAVPAVWNRAPPTTRVSCTNWAPCAWGASDPGKIQCEQDVSHLMPDLFTEMLEIQDEDQSLMLVLLLPELIHAKCT